MPYVGGSGKAKASMVVVDVAPVGRRSIIRTIDRANAKEWEMLGARKPNSGPYDRGGRNARTDSCEDQIPHCLTRAAELAEATFGETLSNYGFPE
jgi:hypothetical protein